MISEFICLEEVQGSDHSVTYMCSLPDPDIDSDLKMIHCGMVHLWEDFASGDCTIYIELLDNFQLLCAGDTYQRKPFLSTILYMLNCKTAFELTHAKIIVKDFMGSYEGCANMLDNV